jgi:hypothetical protein
MGYHEQLRTSLSQEVISATTQLSESKSHLRSIATNFHHQLKVGAPEIRIQKIHYQDTQVAHETGLTNLHGSPVDCCVAIHGRNDLKTIVQPKYNVTHP